MIRTGRVYRRSNRITEQLLLKVVHVRGVVTAVTRNTGQYVDLDGPDEEADAEEKQVDRDARPVKPWLSGETLVLIYHKLITLLEPYEQERLQTRPHEIFKVLSIEALL